MAEENKDSVENTEETQDQAANAAAEETTSTEETAPAAVEEDQEDDVELDLTVPEAPFDWEAYESGQDEYTNDERARLSEVYGNTLTSIQEKEVIDGTVISVGKKEVVINIGYKSEGVVSSSEFRYNPDLAAGDTVPVYIEKQEDKGGQLIISHKTARVLFCEK